MKSAPGTGGRAPSVTRRSMLRSGLASLMAAGLADPLAGAAGMAAWPPTGSSGAGPPRRGKGLPQDDRIVLGVSAAFSGPSRALGTELYRGAMAWFSHVNESGGVNGRRIVLELHDDGYQPDPCVANTIQLIQDPNVFLLFGYVGTPTVTRVLPLLKTFRDQQMYLFFPFTGAEPQREPPYDEFAFNLRASYRQETAGLVNNFARIGRRRIAVFYQNDAYGRSGWAGVREALARHGGFIVGEATYTRGTQYTASMRRQVEILQASGPDAIVCIGAYAACAAFARDAVDYGLHVPVANVSFVGSENLLRLLREGRADPESHTRYLVNSQVVPSYEDTSLPAVREYHELMALHNPPPPDDDAVARIVTGEEYEPFAQSFVSLEGFLNAKLITEILGRMGSNPSRAQIEDAVFAVRDYDIGVGERVSFGPQRRQGLQQVYYTVPQQGRFVPLTDWGERFGSP